MKYTEAIDYLSHLCEFGTRLRLDTTLKLLDFLGNPHTSYNTVHVAGTNGKGSVCAIMDAILRSSDLSIGVYTSPPLSNFTERIRVNGNLIEERDVAKLVDMMAPRVEEMITKGEPPTFFEVVTALAFKYFQETDVDIAIMEVGLGGRLDATNVITPLVSVITNIQKDHTQILGNRIRDIATEKAGIIKKSIPMVTAETDEDALNALKNTCMERDTQLYVVGRDVTFRIKRSNIDGQIFDYHGINDYKNLELGLIGSFQVKNATTALAAVELIDFPIPESAIRAALKNVKWSGRMELVTSKKTILLDCAHNPSGARELANAIKTLFGKKAVFVIGASINKDIRGIFDELSSVSSKFIITKSNHQNAEKARKIANYAGIVDNYVLTENVFDALSRAVSISTNEEIICVTGSIFVVGEARTILKDETT